MPFSLLTRSPRWEFLEWGITPVEEVVVKETAQDGSWMMVVDIKVAIFWESSGLKVC